MDVLNAFLDILGAISEMIGSLLGMLPNPDPFPQILEQLELAGTDSVYVAYYWLDQFFIGDVVVTCLGLWFGMFPIAWIIMMLWKWMKAR